MWPFKKKNALERADIYKDMREKQAIIEAELRLEHKLLEDKKKRAYLGTYKEPELDPRINFWKSEYPNEDYSCLPEYATEYFMERRQAMSRAGLL